MSVKHVQKSNLTIASNETASGELIVGDFEQGGFQIPAAFTGSTISFLASDDGTNFAELRNRDGTEFGSINVQAFGVYSLPVVAFDHFKVKLVSDQAEGEDRSIAVIVKA